MYTAHAQSDRGLCYSYEKNLIFERIPYFSKYFEEARAYSTSPDQKPQNAASNQGLYCLPVLEQDVRHIDTSIGMNRTSLKFRSNSVESLVVRIFKANTEQ